ncbi:MAG: hypothetical protein ACFBZ8_13015 [Opitutales bacterium]
MKKINLWSYTQDDLQRIHSLWFDEETDVLFVDNEFVTEVYRSSGVSPRFRQVLYPSNGRDFFEAFPAAFSGGAVRATPPEEDPDPPEGLIRL